MKLNLTEEQRKERRREQDRVHYRKKMEILKSNPERYEAYLAKSREKCRRRREKQKAEGISEEYRERMRESKKSSYQRKMERIKSDPVRYAAFKERVRAKNKERYRRTRERMKNDPEFREAYLAKEREDSKKTYRRKIERLRNDSEKLAAFRAYSNTNAKAYYAREKAGCSELVDMPLPLEAKAAREASVKRAIDRHNEFLRQVGVTRSDEVSIQDDIIRRDRRDREREERAEAIERELEALLQQPKTDWAKYQALQVERTMIVNSFRVTGDKEAVLRYSRGTND